MVVLAAAVLAAALEGLVMVVVGSVAADWVAAAAVAGLVVGWQ